MIINKLFSSILSRAAIVALLFAGMWISEAKADHPSFKDHVFPILKTYCLDCHQPGGDGFEKSGFDLSNYQNLMKGTKFGPMVIPGDAYTSNLMVLIEGRADTEIMMPHGSYRQEPTRKDRILLRVWINDGAKDSDVFRDEVLPILDMYCLECHLPGGVGYEKSGLDMRDYESLMKGTRFGPVVNPGDAFTSNLMVLIEGRSKYGAKMPYVDQRDLSRREKYLIRAWINRGAKNN
jgi:hypothetical protein